MKKTMISLALSTIAFNSFAVDIPSGYPMLKSEEVYQQMDLENLTSAFVDLQPEAAFMSLYQSYIDAGSTEQNIGIMETSVDPRQIVLTANSETVYAVHPVNLQAQGGAVVLEVPSGVMGMANGPGWTSFADFGLTGPDRGKGGIYLLTAPQWQGEIPEGMLHAPSPTNTIVWLIRAFQGEDGMRGAVNTLREGIKTYSLSDINEPPKTTFYNTSEPVYRDGGYQDMLFHKQDIPELIKQYYSLNGYDAEKHYYNTAHLYHAGFFDGSVDPELAKQAKDLAWERVLTLTFANREDDAYKWDREVSHWVLPNTTADENWTHRSFDMVDPVAQVVWAHQATFTAAAMTRPPKGTGAVYVSTYVDSKGNYLDGSHCYQLNIPAEVPYSNFWSLVTYNAPKRSMIQNDHFSWGINSYQEGLQQNTDGSYSIFWGPNVENNENSIQTNTDEGFFPYFRIYGPTDTWYDNSWVMPNIERVSCAL